MAEQQQSYLESVSTEPMSSTDVRICAGAAMAATFFAPYAESIVHIRAEYDAQTAAAAIGKPVQTPTPQLACKEPGADDYYAVDFMLLNPKSVEFDNIVDQAKGNPLENGNDESIAQRLGATVANETFEKFAGNIYATTDKAAETGPGSEARPKDQEFYDKRRDALFSEVLKIAKDKYSLTIDFLDKERSVTTTVGTATKATPASLNEMNDQDVFILGHELFSLPAEYFKAAKVHTIKLYKAVAADPTKTKALGFTGGDGVLWIDYKSADALAHELGHDADTVSIGGNNSCYEPGLTIDPPRKASIQTESADDKSGIELSDFINDFDDDEAGDEKFDDTEEDDPEVEYSDAATAYSEEDEEQKHSKELARKSPAQAKRVKYVSWYHPTIREAKAEMLKLILRGHIGSGSSQVSANAALSPSTPQLFSNMRRQLARLHALAPGATRYTIYRRILNGPIKKDPYSINPLNIDN